MDLARACFFCGQDILNEVEVLLKLHVLQVLHIRNGLSGMPNAFCLIWVEAVHQLWEVMAETTQMNLIHKSQKQV